MNGKFTTLYLPVPCYKWLYHSFVMKINANFVYCQLKMSLIRTELLTFDIFQSPLFDIDDWPLTIEQFWFGWWHLSIVKYNQARGQCFRSNESTGMMLLFANFVFFLFISISFLFCLIFGCGCNNQFNHKSSGIWGVNTFRTSCVHLIVSWNFHSIIIIYWK